MKLGLQTVSFKFELLYHSLYQCFSHRIGF
jgi:hypothetical protein